VPQIATLAIAFLLSLFIGQFHALAQPAPERFTGELNVCGKVSAAMSEGKSLETALLDLFLSYQDQTPQVYRMIQRGIIHAAIQGCHYDGADVIAAALRVDMNLSLLVLSLSDAGVNPQTVRESLRQAGFSRGAIQEAFEVAAVESQMLVLDYTRGLVKRDPTEDFFRKDFSQDLTSPTDNPAVGPGRPASPFIR